MKPCPYCAEMIQDAAKKCKHCGEWLDPAANPNVASHGHPSPNSYNDELYGSSEEMAQLAQRPTPVAIIVAVWVLVAISFVPFNPLLAIIISFSILALGIVLACIRNTASRVNGWIIIGLWIVSFIIGFSGTL